MSITTKRGDDGHTDLMFGKRVPKNYPRVEAYGTVDELNSLLGVVHHSGVSDIAAELIIEVQKRLIPMMGELATLEEDMPRYAEKGYARLTEEDVQWLENKSAYWEQECDLKFRGWAIPGKEGSIGSAQMDLARAVCRRAERRIADLREENTLANKQIALFLNRLSDLLWILARHEALTYQPEARTRAGGTEDQKS